MFKSLSTVLAAAVLAALPSTPASALMIVPKSLDLAVSTPRASARAERQIDWFSYIGNVDVLVGSLARTPAATADIQSLKPVVGPLLTARGICLAGE